MKAIAFLLLCYAGLRAAAATVTLDQAQTATNLDLVGSVTLPPSRSTVAYVVISFATLKAGLPYPGEGYPRYPIFPKRAQTDSHGNFKIESLDTAWLYNVLILAPGCKSQTFDRVDVAAGPLNVSLKAMDTAKASPDSVLHGRVLDERKNPVAGALIRMQEVTRDNNWLFMADRIDPFSVSDDDGYFDVHGQIPFTDAGGAIEAPGFATGLFEQWTTGDTNHELILTEGAAFKGRLLQAGKPVANAEISLDGFGAESGSWAWACSALTDNDGRFSFEHLPPNHAFVLLGKMESLGSRGVLPERLERVHEVGSTNDIGDLTLEPAFKVEGEIRLTDGKPIPANAQILLARPHSGRMDSLGFAVGKDGSFHFPGVPRETVQLLLRVPGYELTPRDAFLISGSATNITVVTNITGLVIEMKPVARR